MSASEKDDLEYASFGNANLWKYLYHTTMEKIDPQEYIKWLREAFEENTNYFRDPEDLELLKWVWGFASIYKWFKLKAWLIF